MKDPRPKIPELQEELIFRIAQEICAGKSCKDISEGLKKDKVYKVTRNNVYKYFSKAAAKGYVSLVSPISSTLEKAIEEKCGKETKGQITVVNVRSESARFAVAAKAAQFANKKVKSMRGKLVAMGVGPGRSSRDFFEAFGHELLENFGMWAAEGNPLVKLSLHAITGELPLNPHLYSPQAFFNLVDNKFIRESFGFPYTSLVTHKEYLKIQKSENFQNLLSQKEDLDIVVTGLGSFDPDQNDLYQKFLDEGTLKYLRSNHCLGNVQFRPYSRNGIIHENKECRRFCTLFELKELAKFAATKCAILIVRPSFDGKLRTNALLPLLKEKSLKIWSNLFLDVDTALDVLAKW